MSEVTATASVLSSVDPIMENKEYTVLCTGVVQGIGFRPAVYQLAEEMGINGRIRNVPDGVELIIHTDAGTKNVFLRAISELALPGMRIDDLAVTAEGNIKETFGDFRIDAAGQGTGMTEIPIDSAMCESCRGEMFNPDSERNLYPLTACTNCGPRITIIRKLPYRRRDTTMSDFPRCAHCEKYYSEPGFSRRFNFETDSCWNCSPWIALIFPGMKKYIKLSTPYPSGLEKQLAEAGFLCRKQYENSGIGMAVLLDTIHKMLDAGAVIAIKSVGGYQLAADARNASAVDTIRERKHRWKKPLAVMFPDIDSIRACAVCNEQQAQLLASRASPIVLLPLLKGNVLAENVTFEIDQIGAMLPSSPVHHILVDRPLVMTSANLSGEPLIYKDDIQQLSLLADGILLHDRAINVSMDDSLVKCSEGGCVVLRYARGMAPLSFSLGEEGTDSSVSFGADLKSAFTLVTNRRMILSQYIGDLAFASVQHRFRELLERYMAVYNLEPQVVLVDKSPAYHSRSMGSSFAKERGYRVIEVQHHYAHALSVMAEHRLTGRYTAIVMDGTGYGDDGKIWGGEILLVSREGYKRADHLSYIELIGGEKAVRQPFRQLVSIREKLEERYTCLYGMSFWNSETGRRLLDCPLLMKYGGNLENMLNRGINCVETSSAGRLFDLAAAMILDIWVYEYEGEAATMAEQYARKYISRGLQCQKPHQPLGTSSGLNAVDILAGALHEYQDTGDRERALYVFHWLLASSVASSAATVCRREQTDGCILSGGVFQNTILRDMTTEILRKLGVGNIYTNDTTPPGDGGISLGQAYMKITKDEGMRTFE